MNLIHQKENIIKQKKNFHKRLSILGFDTYSDYLKSKHWKQKKEEYELNTLLPNFCLVCKSKKYDIHHTSYARIGDESVYELIALCQKHHKEVHEFLDKNNMFLNATFKAIKEIYNLDIQEFAIRIKEKWKEDRKKHIKIKPNSRFNKITFTKKRRDKHYPVRYIRLDDEVWRKLREEWKKSGLSWNMFFKAKIIDQKLNK